MIFIVFNAFTYINLQVGSGGGGEGGKEKNLCQKKNRFCFVSFSRDCSEAAAHTGSQPSHITHISPKTLVTKLFSHHKTASAGLVQSIFYSVEISKPAPWVPLLLLPLKIPQGLETPCAGSSKGLERCAFSS